MLTPGQHSDGFHRFLSALFVPVLQREPSGRCHRHPAQEALDSDPDLIHMIQPTGDQPLLECPQAPFQGSGCFRHPVGHRVLRSRTVPQISHQFPHPGQRKELKWGQRDRQGLHPWPILGWGIDPRREVPYAEMSTSRACNHLSLVFGDHEPQDRQLVNLPALFHLPGNLG